jgi:L-ascorbate metabolism protein UlaG (beta-lactamase superfamily)
MKVTKLGHCCFVAEPKQGIRIMTDPGDFSTLQLEAKNISAILITHEHGDHLHIESLKKVLENNANAVVITNTAVGKLLTEAGIPFTKVEDGQIHDIDGVTIKGFGDLHAEIYEKLAQVQNTGYMINDLCYPGDSFNMPKDKVDILALPVAGPWVLMKNALNYAKSLKPRTSFPVHDAFIHDWATFLWKWPDRVLTPLGIEFKKLELGKEEDL